MFFWLNKILPWLKMASQTIHNIRNGWAPEIKRLNDNLEKLEASLSGTDECVLVVLDRYHSYISTRRPRGAPTPRALRGFDAINFLPRVGLRRFSLPPVSREDSTHDVIPHSLRRFQAFFPLPGRRVDAAWI